MIDWNKETIKAENAQVARRPRVESEQNDAHMAEADPHANPDMREAESDVSDLAAIQPPWI